MTGRIKKRFRALVDEYNHLEQMTTFGKLIFFTEVIFLYVVSCVLKPKEIFYTMKYKSN